MLAARSHQMLAVLRIVAALCFMEHGCQKLFGFPSVPSFGMPPILSLEGIAGCIEFVGGILVLADASTLLAQILGFVAVVFGSANVFGGFMVTDRMLQMFKKKKK